ncbi:MAG: MATE family efflux transporter [Eubacterium sp.]|nr:MATE family efflux transporter [Eubacterium sp.]
MKNTSSKKYNIDMTNGPIGAKMLKFAFPLMCSSILQLLFNAADTVVVGQFAGDNSLAAVGSNGSLINVMTNLFIGLSVGTNVLIAKAVGAGDREHTRKIVHTSIVISLFGGIVLMIAGLLFARNILVLMDSPPEVIDLASLYLKIYFLGLPAMMVYNFGSAILRAIGDTRRPLYFLSFAGVINVLFNLLFVIAFKMDVAGVALATVISQIISAVLIMLCLFHEKSDISVSLREMKIDMDSLARILRIGIPAGLQGTLFSFSNVIIQSSINSFGATVVAGNSAAQNLEGFVYVSMNAFHQATLSFTSQNMGAGKTERIGKILRSGLILVFITGLVLGGLVAIFGSQLLHIYSPKKMVISKGAERLVVVCGTYYLCGIMDVMVGSIRGLGYSIMPMIVSLIGACGLRIIWLKTFFKMAMFHKPFYIYATYPVSWAITILAHVVCYFVIKKKMKI